MTVSRRAVITALSASVALAMTGCAGAGSSDSTAAPASRAGGGATTPDGVLGLERQVNPTASMEPGEHPGQCSQRGQAVGDGERR